MTTVTFPAATTGVDMTLNFFPDPDAATKATRTASTFTVYYAPTEYDRFTGSGFKYDGLGNPIAGTIASWTYVAGGKTYLSATGINMPVVTFIGYLEADNWMGFLADAFSDNDKITGTPGPDTLFGFEGNDLINGGGLSDFIRGDGGNDTVLGGAGDDVLEGGDGNDVLDGGIGADDMTGGTGDDTYIVDNTGDTVTDGDGIDTVKSSVTFGVGVVIDNITLTGTKAISAFGNSLANVLTGNAAGNILEGLGNNDTLLGGAGKDTLVGDGGNDWLDGGAGKDTMKGSSGDDIYVIDSASDVVDEEDSDDAADQVRSSITVDLNTLSDGRIEHATLTGKAAINAFGNVAANILAGNDAANTLDGRGGADTMAGGKGADTYIVDSELDQVIETLAGAPGGVDIVKSTVNFSLATLDNVEKLTLLGSDDDDLEAMGNGLNNVLTGDGGNNLLDGGAGKDTMIGGKGHDLYIVDNAGDVVTEALSDSKGGGSDEVRSSVTYSLASRVNVDDLTLTGVDNINGTGNALRNIVMGNAGNNKIDGAGGNDYLTGGDGQDTLIGGAGNDILVGGDNADTMTGGAGRDTYSYSDLDDASDTITDFKLGASGDLLRLGDLLADVDAPDDPFASGHLKFDIVGKDTLVRVDSDGSVGDEGFITRITLKNVHLTSTDTANYDRVPSPP